MEVLKRWPLLDQATGDRRLHGEGSSRAGGVLRSKIHVVCSITHIRHSHPTLTPHHITPLPNAWNELSIVGENGKDCLLCIQC